MSAEPRLASSIKYPDRLFIGGEWVTPQGNDPIDVFASATEDLYIRVAGASETDIDRAVASAREAFDRGPWPKMSHAERGAYLRELGAGLAARAAEVAEIWPNETGILHSIAQASMPWISSAYDYYAGLADTFPFEEERQPMQGALGLLVREPVGVVAAIIPWNGPAQTIAFKMAPALIAGCTIIVKAAPEAPGAAYVMAEIAEAVGIPPGVINIVAADRAASERLVRHEGVDKVSFTGSTATGKRIGSICAERVARCSLELGGKSAAIIMDDYDVGQAAEILSQNMRVLSGQVCAALSRVVVSRKQHDAFVEAMSASFQAIKVGDPFDPATEMGPVAMRRQRDRVEEMIAVGLSDGCQLATGGGRPAGHDRGYFIEPTLFKDVDNDSRIAREEIFGPVVCVIAAEDEESAIELANDSPYGLNSSVFTDDPDRAYRAARGIRAGTVGHNGFRVDHSIGFGGFKQSGIGREGGVEGLLPYLETKAVILDGVPARRR